MATASRRTGREHSGMRTPKFRPIGPLAGELCHFQYFQTRRPYVRHIEFKKHNIWSRMRFDYHVKIWCRPDLRRRRYCDFMILLVWLENV